MHLLHRSRLMQYGYETILLETISLNTSIPVDLSTATTVYPWIVA